MSISKNLYNKYRPSSFAEIIGQETIKKLLIQTFTKEKLLQSYLFYGSHGTGKTSLARIFAKAWNCDSFSELGDVCNKCPCCKLINENATVDICEVDSASNSGVDNVRELIDNSRYMPLDLKKKVYIVDECHNLSNTAWNALLKTIEEPHSENIIFIFLTTNIHKVPDTILSRCQKYNFSRLSEGELKEVIQLVEEGENRRLTKEAKDLLISLSQGSARECIGLIEQSFLSCDQEEITRRDIENLFALANKEEHIKFLELLIGGDKKQLIEIVDDLIVKSRHLLNYFSSLLSISMDVHTYELTGDSSLLKFIDESDLERLLGKNFNYLDLCDELSKAIRNFNSSYSKSDWAKMTLFHLFPRDEESFSFTPKVVEEQPKVVEEIKEPEEEEIIDLSVPKDIELKFLYNTVESNRDKSKSKDNYRIYQDLKSNTNLNSSLREVLFQESICFPSSQMITTDKTVLLLFKDKLEADKFNALVTPGSKYEKELNKFFLKEYFWWAASLEQMKFYKTKDKPTDNEINKAFEREIEEDVFNKLISILES